MWLLGVALSATVLSCQQNSLRADKAEAVSSKLPVYELKIDPKDFRALARDPYSNQTHPATFLADGETYQQVKVRYRGDWARSWPKKPLKIIFNENEPFRGERCLNLNSCWRDPAFIREHLAYELYANCAAAAPKTRMVRLQVNGRFEGLYVEVQQPDKPFLRRVNLKGAALFKTISKSNHADERDLGREQTFSAHYSRETHKADGFGELQQFCHDLARATNVLDFFNQRVDLDAYVNFLAVTALIQNWDCFNKNHYLAYNRQNSKKWSVIPWDLDRTFGDHWQGMFDYAQLPALLGTRQLPGTTGWNRLEDRFFSEPALRSRFVNRLAELLQNEFTPQKLFPVIDRLESEISPEAALDRRRWPAPTPDLHTGITQLKGYITHRRAYLLAELGTLRGDPRAGNAQRGEQALHGY